MNSPFANLFLAIQERIQTQVPGIAHIDQELGQLRPGPRPPVSFPCVLVDFEDFTFENLGDNVQTASGNVVLRLAFSPGSNSSQSTPDEIKEKAIAYYDLEWQLHHTIQGWCPGDDYGHMIRTSSTTQKRDDILRVRSIVYRLGFEDYSTKNVLQYVRVPVEIREE